MSSTIGWIAALGVSVCAVIIAAGAGQADLHMIACAVVALALTLMAVRESHALIAGGASKNIVAGATARNMGLVWAWGAVAIFTTYNLVLEGRWPEWWHFFLGFAIAAAGSLLFAGAVARDEAKGVVDQSVNKIGRALIIAQIVGVAAGLISMFVDGKFPRPTRYVDWAGCNIFFFGGLAILAISLNALRNSRE
ncbi:MAG: hypothetical protein ACT4OU_01165 [Hyphomicrobium sp.]